MAERIESFVSSKGRPPKYPWEDWTNGDAWKLYKGKDFDADLISFRTMVHRKARDLGPHVGAYTHINKADQSVRVQFYRRHNKGS